MTLSDIYIEVTDIDTPTDEEIMREYIADMWVNEEKKIINENVFACAFRDINQLSYNNGLFYTRTGKTTEELLLKDIWESIADKAIDITKDVERVSKRLLGAVKLASTVKKLEVSPNIIPFANGDLHLDKDGWEFRHGEFSSTAYRLPIELKNHVPDTPYFDKWKKDLFYDEDIETLQRYVGYCLVPTTRAQKALFLVGEGGTGKSVLGVILEAILGDVMVSVSNTQEFLEDKFKLPELENSLVLYDDDMDNAALNGTGLYKKLITNNLTITADRKYGQPFKFKPYIKLVACCNEMLSSKYDNTEGFYRRLLPIRTKPRAKNFKPDKNFYDKIRAEAPGIVHWALVGLQHLITNDWVLPESDRTKEYIRTKRAIGNSLEDFMDTVFDFIPGEAVTSANIWFVYELWCRKNAYDPKSKRSVQTWLADNAEKYGLIKTCNISVAGGKHLNGYKNLKIKKEWMEVTENQVTIKSSR